MQKAEERIWESVSTWSCARGYLWCITLFLPSLSFHISIPSISRLSPSTVTTSDRAMLFLLTAVRPNIASAHSSWLKADTFFSGPVSSPCYPLPVFSPFSFSSALLFHLCLFLTNTHRRTHSACLCLAAAGWHHVVEKTVCGNLSQEILVLHTFPFVYFVREKLLRVTAPRSSWGTSWLDSAYTHTHTHTNKHQSGCSVQLFFNFLSV